MLNILVWANSADPAQTAPRQQVTVKFSGVRKFRNFTVSKNDPMILGGGGGGGEGGILKKSIPN